MTLTRDQADPYNSAVTDDQWGAHSAPLRAHLTRKLNAVAADGADNALLLTARDTTLSLFVTETDDAVYLGDIRVTIRGASGVGRAAMNALRDYCVQTSKHLIVVHVTNRPFFESLGFLTNVGPTELDEPAYGDLFVLAAS